MPDQVETCLSEAIITEIPHLRAYALLMTNDVSTADQEVTETLKQALSNRERLCKRPAYKSAFDNPQKLSHRQRAGAAKIQGSFGDLRAPQGAFSEGVNEPRIRSSVP